MALEKTEEQKRLEEERKIEEAQARHKALVSVQEAATGMQYTEPMKTSWTPPKHIRDQPEENFESIRKKFHILLEGNDPVPPIKHFQVSHGHFNHTGLKLRLKKVKHPLTQPPY